MAKHFGQKSFEDTETSTQNHHHYTKLKQHRKPPQSSKNKIQLNKKTRKHRSLARISAAVFLLSSFFTCCASPSAAWTANVDRRLRQQLKLSGGACSCLITATSILARRWSTPTSFCGICGVSAFSQDARPVSSPRRVPDSAALTFGLGSPFTPVPEDPPDTVYVGQRSPKRSGPVPSSQASN